MTNTYDAAITDDLDTVDDTFEPTTGTSSASPYSEPTYQAQAEGRPFAPTTSLRQAVRDDLDNGRQWARHTAEATREQIVEEPLKAALYAVGAGILIGLLLRR